MIGAPGVRQGRGQQQQQQQGHVKLQTSASLHAWVCNNHLEAEACACHTQRLCCRVR